ncbi:MAG: DUF4271 domain-containing protein [Muribaculaceae bacterium]|nr:DUF4271 domain-containing protein [Muribaculaceae bacterium]
MQYPWNSCTPSQAPLSPAEREMYVSRPPAWQQGIAGTSRVLEPGADSGVVAMLLFAIVLIGLNMRHVRRFFASVPHDLLSVRRRANAFDEHTAAETRVVILLLLQLFILEGILLFCWLGQPLARGTAMQTDSLTAVVGALAGAGAALYIFQLAACRTVGYVFTDNVAAGLWRRGLNASQSILSLALLGPALVALFYPALGLYMLILAAALYVLSRICYIIKGFRIFYTDFTSLLYFILYLCTLEIIPVIFICAMAREICVILI